MWIDEATWDALRTIGLPEEQARAIARTEESVPDQKLRQMYIVVINGRSATAAALQKGDFDGGRTEGEGDAQLTHPQFICTRLDFTDETYVLATRFPFDRTSCLLRSIYLPRDSIVAIHRFDIGEGAAENELRRLREGGDSSVAMMFKNCRRSFAAA